METSRYQRKPFEVDALQLTADNFAGVAEKTQGEIRTKINRAGHEVKYIKIFVNRPLNEAQTEAYVGDWLLYTPSGWKIYKDGAFRNCFEKVRGEIMSAKEIQKLLDFSVEQMKMYEGPKLLDQGLPMQETREWEQKAANLEGVVYRELGDAMERQDDKTANGGSIDGESRIWRGQATSKIMEAVTALFAPSEIKLKYSRTPIMDRLRREQQVSLPIPNLKPLAKLQQVADEMRALREGQTLQPYSKVDQEAIAAANELLHSKPEEVPVETLVKVVDGLKHLDDGPAEITPEQREALLANSKSVAEWMLSTEEKLPGTFAPWQIEQEIGREEAAKRTAALVEPTQVIEQIKPPMNLGLTIQPGVFNEALKDFPKQVETGLRKFQKQAIDYVVPMTQSPKDQMIEHDTSRYEYKPEDIQNH